MRETSLQINAISLWLGANLESALGCVPWGVQLLPNFCNIESRRMTFPPGDTKGIWVTSWCLARLVRLQWQPLHVLKWNITRFSLISEIPERWYICRYKVFVCKFGMVLRDFSDDFCCVCIFVDITALYNLLAFFAYFYPPIIFFFTAMIHKRFSNSLSQKHHGL